MIVKYVICVLFYFRIYYVIWQADVVCNTVCCFAMLYQNIWHEQLTKQLLYPCSINRNSSHQHLLFFCEAILDLEVIISSFAAYSYEIEPPT